MNFSNNQGIQRIEGPLEDCAGIEHRGSHLPKAFDDAPSDQRDVAALQTLEFLGFPRIVLGFY